MLPTLVVKVPIYNDSRSFPTSNILKTDGNGKQNKFYNAWAHNHRQGHKSECIISHPQFSTLTTGQHSVMQKTT